MKHIGLCLLLAGACAASLHAQTTTPTGQIRLNQIGFYPDLPKVAAVMDATGTEFYVTSAGTADTVFTGTLGALNTWIPANETAQLADFTALRTPGRYRIVVPGVGSSYEFEIKTGVFQGVAQAAIKGFYYQRASTSLGPVYAGRWARPAGHPDTNVRVHPSAASPGRPAGTVLASPKGWYDAGDYNKYIVNSGISTATLLALYEHFPAYFDRLDLNIPESENDVPDLLDEALWNIRWMLTMQDPGDGGVYHKLTTPNFEGYVMPAQARQQRYVVQKSTAAALDFAAVMAQASRIFSAFPDQLPGLSDSTLGAARGAWQWARQNPAVYYRQNTLNQAFEPDINTGEYGDGNVSDEFMWAATELYITAKEDSFITAFNPFTVQDINVPAWPSVAALGFYSLLHNADALTPAANMLAIEREVIELADELTRNYRNSPFGVVMGGSNNEFGWGSNSTAANQSMALIQAFRLSEDSLYLDAALSNFDYLLGRNATGYSFVTEYGTKTPMHPHHRPSAADGIRQPVPGLLVGGPNPGQQDKGDCPANAYPSVLPARSYVDHLCSYASNEIAINWNAPLAYVAGAFEALLSPTGTPVQVAPPEGGQTGSVESERLHVYPNPAREAATVTFSLETPAVVTLGLFDMTGREVVRLLDNRAAAAGAHTVTFSAHQMPRGVYAFRLSVANGSPLTALVVLI